MSTEPDDLLPYPPRYTLGERLLLLGVILFSLGWIPCLGYFLIRS